MWTVEDVAKIFIGVTWALVLTGIWGAGLYRARNLDANFTGMDKGTALCLIVPPAILALVTYAYT